jgi:hypothetical protein
LIKVIVAPSTPPAVHTVAVVVVNVTANPDEAVALTVTGDCANVLSASAAKVIVWVAFTVRTSTAPMVQLPSLATPR